MALDLVQKAGLAIQAYPEKLPIRERTIEGIANEMHDAVDSGDTDLAESLYQDALAELELFSQEERERNPQTAEAKIAMMYSIVHDAAGRYEEAISYDIRSLELAQTDDERAKALHNTACAYNQLGQHELALSFHNMALALKPREGWTLAGWAKAKVALDQTEEIFDRVARAKLDDHALAVFEAHLQKDSWLGPVRDDLRWSFLRLRSATSQS